MKIAIVIIVVAIGSAIYHIAPILYALKFVG